MIETGDTGSVRLLMRDKSVLALAPKSGLAISEYSVSPKVKKRTASLTVLLGRLWAFISSTANPEATYEVRTGNAVAGVRGTEFVFDVDAAGKSEVTVIEGEVQLASETDQRTVGRQQRASVAGEGVIELGETTADAIRDLRETVKPDQELDSKSADRRIAATRKKTGGSDVDGAECEESGSGTALCENLNRGGRFESLPNYGGGTGGGDTTSGAGTRLDNPRWSSTNVRLSVQVRP